MHSRTVLALLAASTAAIVLPLGKIPFIKRLGARADIPATTQAEAVFTCDRTWCAAGILKCQYWDGPTSYDPTTGAMPSKKVINLGICPSPSLDPVTTIGSSVGTGAGRRNDDDDGYDGSEGVVAVKIVTETVGQNVVAFELKTHTHTVKTTIWVTPSDTATAHAPAVTATGSDAAPAPTGSATIQCHNQWCSDNGTRYCMYWAGVTGYDPSKGPVPGETITALGDCDVAAATKTA